MKPIRLFLLLALVALAALPAAAQTDRCRDGAALFADGLYAEAAEAYACTIEASPNDPELYRGLITAYLMAGQYYDAESTLSPLRAVFTTDDGSSFLEAWEAGLADSDEPGDQMTRAFVLWALARDTDAQPIYEELAAEAEGIPAEFAQVFSLSSGVWLGNLTGAAAVDSALALDTDNAQVFTFLANTLYFAAGDEDVDALTSAALEGFADDPTLLTQRARSLIRMDRAEEGIALLEQVEAVAPERADLELYLTLADAYAAAGDVAGAQSASERAVELGETEDMVIYTLMQANENAGEIEAASSLALDYINLSRRVTIRRDVGEGNEGPYSVTMREGLVVEMRFEAADGVPYTFTAISVNPNEVDPFIVLLDAEGTPIAFNDDRDAAANEYDSLIDQLVLAGGSYTLIISHAGLGSSGPVEVNIAVY